MKFGKQNENSDDDGINETVDILCKVDDLELITKYGRWVFAKNPIKGIKIFTFKR